MESVSWSQKARGAGEESVTRDKESVATILNCGCSSNKFGYDEPIMWPEFPGAGEDSEPSMSTCKGDEVPTELAAAAVGTMYTLSISSRECPSVFEESADIKADEKCAKSIWEN